MTQPEIRALELRLRTELEQVRALQKRVVSMSSNVSVFSPSSDIRSGSDGKKRPILESFERSSEVHAAQGRKRAPPGRKQPHTKRDVIGNLESPKQAAALSSSNAMLMKQCQTLLSRLMSHQHGWVFNTPVDVENLNIPDYFTIIKNPMDLGTVKNKLVSGQYSSPRDFAADVRLTFSNARTYNPPGNGVHVMAEILSKFFEVRWKPIEKKFRVVMDLESAVPSRSVFDLESDSAIPPSKKPKVITVDHIIRPEPVKQVMSKEEKHTLSTELEALLAELPENIVDFLKEHSFSEGQTGEDEIEIDIDALSDDTLFVLRKLLNDYMLEKQNKLERAEPSEVELPNESGLSNSSVQPCIGNVPVDEDVDIGGNDLPLLGYPPVEIKKDTGLRNSKCSSSSSSSSESGSSSSESDSGSSSDSESDGVEASVTANATKEALGSAANIYEKKSDPSDAESIIGLGQVEQTSQPVSVLAEMKDQQDGESAPSERQVSPEKLYRAVLLRSRFADTILKAREKALEKTEKLDPEKLWLEKEDLERRQKEEKARLRAKAKAAEEARRKAEAEAEAKAAVEAKMNRELEREAARLALQKMEKTVDINENSQFMEDLEMLRAAPVEQLAFIDEMSPDRSLNALGSFKFEGTSNPLEQLGLYMKDEDDDDEEVGPQRLAGAENDAGEEDEARRIAEPVNDIEEGEYAEAVNDVEDGVPLRIPLLVNDVENGEPQRIAEPVNDVEEEYAQAVNDVQDGDSVPQRIPLLVNDVEEDGEPQRIAEVVNDVEDVSHRIHVSVNDVEEEGGELQRIDEAVIDVEEEEAGPQRITEPVNDVEVEEGDLKRITELENVEEKQAEPQRISEPVNDVEE